MIIKDIMTSPVMTIDQNKPAVQANELMWRHQMHHLVVTHNDQIVGILSDTDLGGEHATEIPDNLLVKNAMSSPITTITTTATVDKAVNLMTGNGFRSLPVLDEEGNLVGIVTKTDLERLGKRGKAQGPFQGQQKIDPRVPLAKREGRGAHSKFGAGHG